MSAIKPYSSSSHYLFSLKKNLYVLKLMFHYEMNRIAFKEVSTVVLIILYKLIINFDFIQVLVVYFIIGIASCVEIIIVF